MESSRPESYSAGRLDRPLELDRRSQRTVVRLDRSKRNHLFQRRAPGRAGRLADLTAPHIQRDGNARGFRIHRRCQPLLAVELLQGLPCELEADEPPRRPAALLLAFERAPADEFSVL